MWKNYLSMNVISVDRNTMDVITIGLRPADGSRPPAFKAGQYVPILLEIDKQKHFRCYSLSSSPIDEEMEITVKKIPNGIVSTHLQYIAPGQNLKVGTPFGDFVLDEADNFFGLAAGSGITPIYSMIKQLLYGTDKKAKLLYISRSPAEAILGNQLQELQVNFPTRFELAMHYTKIQGRLTKTELENWFTNTSASRLYLCGPETFMQLVGEHVETAKLNIELITESFTNTVKEEEHQGQEYSVSFRSHNWENTIQVNTNQTLLAAALAGGLPIPYGCMTGKCGGCMARLEEGSVQHKDSIFLSEDDIAEGLILCCQSQPKENCTLRLE